MGLRGRRWAFLFSETSSRRNQVRGESIAQVVECMLRSWVQSPVSPLKLNKHNYPPISLSPKKKSNKKINPTLSPCSSCYTTARGQRTVRLHRAAVLLNYESTISLLYLRGLCLWKTNMLKNIKLQQISGKFFHTSFNIYCKTLHTAGLGSCWC